MKIVRKTASKQHGVFNFVCLQEPDLTVRNLDRWQLGATFEISLRP